MELQCMVVDDEEMSLTIVSRFIEKTSDLNLKYQFQDAIEAIQTLQKDEEIDLLFLDIEMPEMNGIEFLQSLQEKSRNLQIILTTSQIEYAVDAFEYDVTDYLVKPIKYPRFLKSVQKVQEYFDQKQEGGSKENGEKGAIGALNSLFIKADGKITKVDLSDILYIEALADYVIVKTRNSKLIAHTTLKGLAQKLAPSNKFFRIHRSYIINVEHVSSIEDSYVKIEDNNLPLGRSYKKDLYEKLNVL